MKIFIHTENNLMRYILPQLARKVEEQTQDYEYEIHLVDAAYTRLEFSHTLMNSGLLAGGKVVLISEPALHDDLPDCDALRIDITEDVDLICNTLIDLAMENSEEEERRRAFPHVLTRLEERTLRLYLFGMSIKDIAQIMAVSEKRIYARLGSTRKKMNIPGLQHFSFQAVSQFKQRSFNFW